MGTVKYKGKIWKGVSHLFTDSEGNIRIYEYNCPAMSDSFKIPSGARLKIEGDKDFYMERFESPSCVLLEGTAKEVQAGNMVEVIGDVDRIEEGNVSYIPKEELSNNFTSIRDKMKSGRFAFGEKKRHVIHLSGSFRFGFASISHDGIIEVDLKGKVDKVISEKSVMVKGKVGTVKKAKTVKISK